MVQSGHRQRLPLREAWLNVRFWHKADIGLRGLNVCFGGKAGIGAARITWRVENAPSPNQILAETYLIALPLRAPFKP